ncbi:zinc-binding metallopeptidase family protein [Achromobacter sp. NCFB-sbj8-Ac1-l]|uniref:zinc-binding metallopeptidase family protein n=1 Tax=unclassified Achromobacter TaxID=2626865 RepID=UPI004046CFB3
MTYFFDALGRQLNAPKRQRLRQRHARAKAFQCVCGQQIFFGNTECLNCHRPLGFDPKRGHVLALDPGKTEGVWAEAGRVRGRAFKRCGNFATPALCNWLLPATSPDTLCLACSLNRTIPDLSIPENGPLWFKVEAAKRQLIAQLMTLGLPIRRSQEPGDGGLAFDLLAPGADGAPLLTGHNQGLITINILEADDAYRVQVRESMREPYRTLLGHFRHEIGHFYWDQLVAGGPWLEPFRQLFGDERADYAQALQRNYEQGPPADWALHFISTYASCHPWEDWAETWAHYLHMMDTLDTAISFGVTRMAVEQAYEPFTRVSLYDQDDPEGQGFLDLVNAWVALTGVLNELSRSMGQRDFYPFVLPGEVVGKLQFVHRVVKGAAR